MSMIAGALWAWAIYINVLSSHTAEQQHFARRRVRGAGQPEVEWTAVGEKWPTRVNWLL